MSINFTAIDFETANSSRASACAIGLVKIRDGKEIGRISEVFNPPEGFDDFDAWNVMIHGITKKQVRNKKRFGELWSIFREFIGEDIVVAHNASFDFSVLRHALKESNIEWPTLNYLCSMTLAKPVFSLTSYSLPIVAKSAGVQFDEDLHHDAAYDAFVSAQIILKIAETRKSNDLNELCNELKVSLGILNSENWDACRVIKPSKPRNSNHNYSHAKANEVEVNLHADPEHPFYDKFFAFTGTLSAFKRIDAWQAVAYYGGIPEDNVTKLTNYLVVGEQDPTKFRKGDTTSAKYQKAEKLRLAGQEIEVIYERDFVAMLEPVKG